MYVRTYVCMYVCTYVCMYVCMYYVCTYVCTVRMYVCISVTWLITRGGGGSKIDLRYKEL